MRLLHLFSNQAVSCFRPAAPRTAEPRCVPPRPTAPHPAGPEEPHLRVSPGDFILCWGRTVTRRLAALVRMSFTGSRVQSRRAASSGSGEVKWIVTENCEPLLRSFDMDYCLVPGGCLVGSSGYPARRRKLVSVRYSHLDYMNIFTPLFWQWYCGSKEKRKYLVYGYECFQRTSFVTIRAWLLTDVFIIVLQI